MEMMNDVNGFIQIAEAGPNSGTAAGPYLHLLIAPQPQPHSACVYEEKDS